MPSMYFGIKKAYAELLERHLSKTRGKEFGLYFNYSLNSYFPTNIDAQSVLNFVFTGQEVLEIGWATGGEMFGISTNRAGPILPTQDVGEVVYSSVKGKKSLIETIKIGDILKITIKSPILKITRVSDDLVERGKQLYRDQVDAGNSDISPLMDSNWWLQAAHEYGVNIELDDIQLLSPTSCKFEVVLVNNVVLEVIGTRVLVCGVFDDPKFTVKGVELALAINEVFRATN